MMMAALVAGGLAMAAQAAAQTPKKGGTLIYATGTDATTLDPQFVTDVPTSRMVMHVHESLVHFTDSGEVRPALAESWSVSADKRIWTFKLRQGVAFHDGTAFDAEAVKYTFDRILDPATGSPRRSTATVIKEVKVVDPHTVAFTTDKPFAPFLAQISAYNLAILSPTQARKVGKDYAQKPAGTGPFKLQSWTPGDKMVLARNDAYWGPKPHLDRIEIRIVPEDSARVLQLLGGEADVIASVPPVMLPRLKSSRDVRVLQKTGFRTIYIGINTTVKPFDDPRVRQALAHAIDTEAIVKGVLGGIGTRGGGIESPVIAGAHKNLPPVKHDKALAKKLLAEAGLASGFPTTLYSTTGRYLNDRQVAEAVQAQLREVGIIAKIETPEFATYQQMLDSRQKLPLFLLGKGSPTGDLDMTLNLTTLSSGRMNYYGWKDEEVDSLIARQREATDQAERFKLLDRIQEKFYADNVVIVLFYEDQLFGARAKVHDVAVYPNEFVSFFQAWKE
jgi:peptide/nickel transport system substrate-binding protein